MPSPVKKGMDLTPPLVMKLTHMGREVSDSGLLRT